MLKPDLRTQAKAAAIYDDFIKSANSIFHASTLEERVDQMIKLIPLLQQLDECQQKDWEAFAALQRVMLSAGIKVDEFSKALSLFNGIS